MVNAELRIINLETALSTDFSQFVASFHSVGVYGASMPNRAFIVLPTDAKKADNPENLQFRVGFR
jgi:hypothetical protein